MNEVLKMFNEAVTYYGASDLITIMLSQRVDKLKAEELDGLKISYSNAAGIYQNIFNTSPDKRKDIKGMDKARADIILAGLTPMKVLMDMTGSNTVIICNSGVKEGVFFRMKNEILKERNV